MQLLFCSCVSVYVLNQVFILHTPSWPLWQQFFYDRELLCLKYLSCYFAKEDPAEGTNVLGLIPLHSLHAGLMVLIQLLTPLRQEICRNKSGQLLTKGGNPCRRKNKWISSENNNCFSQTYLWCMQFICPLLYSSHIIKKLYICIIYLLTIGICSCSTVKNNVF